MVVGLNEHGGPTTVRRRGSLEDTREPLDDALRNKKQHKEKKANATALKTFGYFSIALFVLPLFTYFLCKRFILPGIHMVSKISSIDNVFMCGIAAVVVLKLVLVAYIAMAAYEEYVENK